jgi:hypothetical protein
VFPGVTAIEFDFAYAPPPAPKGSLRPDAPPPPIASAVIEVTPDGTVKVPVAVYTTVVRAVKKFQPVLLLVFVDAYAFQVAPPETVESWMVKYVAFILPLVWLMVLAVPAVSLLIVTMFP